MTTKYYDTFSIVSRFTGYTSDITIGDFYNDLAAKYCGSTAILGGFNQTAREEKTEKSEEAENSDKSEESGNNSSNEESSENKSKDDNIITNPEHLTSGTSSITGKRGTENFGLAVFKDGIFNGELTATESICHLLITNELDSCVLSIDDPFHDGDKLEVELSPAKKTKTTVKIENEIPKISINLSLNTDILTLESDTDYEIDEILRKLAGSTEKYLKEQFNNYLNKISKEYNTDIDQFCAKAQSNFLTIPEWENFNWSEKFKNSEFDVNIDINIVSSPLVTKT